VWVAAGTYVIPEGAETDTLQLRPGVEVYGGFAGSETALEERDWVVNETVLDGTGMTGSDPHLVTGSEDSLLDGFTVTNTTGWTGGAAYAGDSALDIANCIFHDNLGVMGGIVDVIRSSATISDCVFFLNYQNGTPEDGADVRIWDSSASISGCVFRGDPAGEQDSFAIDVNGDEQGANATITNCVFSNLSNGAIRIVGPVGFSSLATVTNGTFFGSTDGIAIDVMDGNNAIVTNSVFWGNGEDINGPFAASYSDFGVEIAGDGNIVADPLFFDPENGDFHLKAGSPCIDAADGDAAPELDLDGNPRVDDPGTTDTGAGAITYADIGAFEYQPE
jgi:hypothetical protein